jgi:hypothetical protein
MAYIFKQKLNIHDLAGVVHRQKRVLVHEPEEYLSALYGHYLREHNFDVKHCPDLGKISHLIASFRPDVLVFCSDATHSLSSREIKKLLSGFSLELPDLRLVATGLNSSGELLRELMSAGVLGHINRKLSRPQDLVVVIKSIL